MIIVTRASHIEQISTIVSRRIAMTMLEKGSLKGADVGRPQ
jgi:hypothetical protein